MLRRITWKKFVTWKAFDELEPIGGQRLDHLTASIVSTLVNLRRNVDKYPDPFPLADFLLKWGSDSATVKPPPKPTGKTWQQLKLMGQVLAALYNQAEDDHNKRRRRKG
jgi:hypothetical protein